MIFFLFITGLSFLFILNILFKDQESTPNDSLVYKENFRPKFHFSPPKNWMNDPNGLLYHEGEYHLFYQYNPWGNQWGHMSWGHAVSQDLVHWENLPVALFEEDDTMIFSGSAVADQKNTSGFGENGKTPLVAIYTSHVPDKVQHQSLAFSLDNGRSWTKYQQNPVLDLGMKDFRDPKVIWIEDGNYWLMLVVLPKERLVYFYKSFNLIDWEKVSEFGMMGDLSQDWECPDLIKLRIAGTNQSKWVLMISSGGSYPGFQGMHYFVGSFDGTHFIPEQTASLPLWLEYGKDFYAAVCFNGLEEKMDPVLIGWANNWKYGQELPTTPWRSCMAIPRSLCLKERNGIYLISQQAVEALQELRMEEGALQFSQKQILPDSPFTMGLTSHSMQLVLKIKLDQVDRIHIDLFVHPPYKTRLTYSAREQLLLLDRTQSGITDFHSHFPSIEQAPLRVKGDLLELEILLDQSLIEVFTDEGMISMTEQVFPMVQQSNLSLSVEQGAAELLSAHFFPMRSIWA